MVEYIFLNVIIMGDCTIATRKMMGIAHEDHVSRTEGFDRSFFPLFMHYIRA